MIKLKIHIPNILLVLNVTKTPKRLKAVSLLISLTKTDLKKIPLG